MSDQYIPPTRPAFTPGAVPPAAEPYRSSVHVEVPQAREAGSGFGTGMLVAMVFVVVAILAAVVFGYNRSVLPVSDGVPAVTIENNAAPAPAAPAPMVADPVAPAAPAAPPVAEPATPAPDAGTAAPAAPANP
jgi:hypothetical protein